MAEKIHLGPKKRRNCWWWHWLARVKNPSQDSHAQNHRRKRLLWLLVDVYVMTGSSGIGRAAKAVRSWVGTTWRSLARGIRRSANCPEYKQNLGLGLKISRMFSSTRFDSHWTVPIIRDQMNDPERVSSNSLNQTSAEEMNYEWRFWYIILTFLCASLEIEPRMPSEPEVEQLRDNN